MKKNRELPDYFDEEISFWEKVENAITVFALFITLIIGVISAICIAKPWLSEIFQR